MDINSITRKLDEFEKALDERFSQISNMQKTEILRQVKEAVKNNDLKALDKITAP
jgi:hypothetical protein